MPRIAVLIETGSGWGRRLIRGIANYGLKQGPWQLTIEAKAGRSADGIIAWVNNKTTYDELKNLGKPVVNISAIILDGVDFPRITTDYNALARLAFQHFTERGFTNIAYRGMRDEPYGQRHCQAFVQAVELQGLHCHVFHSRSKRHLSLTTRQAELQEWLKGLPKPVGIFTWDSRMGMNILNLSYENGFSVPEQVAVLAGDEDELLCECSHPSLSAIVTPGEQIGYTAARMLNDMLHGKACPSKETLLEPTEVITRQSTDTLAIPDRHLSEAIRFIRENMHRPIQVNDIAKATGISRRSLERRFESMLGHSPAREIQQSRIRHAKRLLRETDMSVADVAAASGYNSMEYMIKLFKDTEGRTPLKYRRWIRAN